MGILSAMINSGAIEIEVESAGEVLESSEVIDSFCNERVVNKLLGYNWFSVISDTGKTNYKVYPKEYSYGETDEYMPLEFYGAPEEFMKVVHTFFYLWSTWLGEVSRYYAYGKIPESVYAAADFQFIERMMRIFYEFNPSGIAYRGDIIRIEDFMIFGLIPPPLKDILPGYEEEVSGGLLDQLTNGKIDVIQIY